MSQASIRRIPKKVYELRLSDRIKWARQSARLSHDKLVERMGRSNRGHLIKIEKGDHMPRRDLRDAIADACGVPRDLFDTEDEDDSSMEMTRDFAVMFERAVERAIDRRIGRVASA